MVLSSHAVELSLSNRLSYPGDGVPGGKSGPGRYCYVCSRSFKPEIRRHDLLQDLHSSADVNVVYCCIDGEPKNVAHLWSMSAGVAKVFSLHHECTVNRRFSLSSRPKICDGGRTVSDDAGVSSLFPEHVS